MRLINRAGVMVAAVFITAATPCIAQIDPMHRNLVELGYDQPLTGHGPQALYAYYYYNNPEFLRTNLALRLAIAPAYFDGELGFKSLVSPYTDIGIGIFGGAFADSFYEVRRGRYLRGESFDGHSGGTSVNLYQLLDPKMLIPLNLIVRGGMHYSTYTRTDDTKSDFALPSDQTAAFFRTGLRLAGKEPMLYPQQLGFELSVWFERQWRFNGGDYGLNGDRRVQDSSDLYWIYAGLNYAWTNTGQQISFSITVGGSSDADRFSAWRLGGVLPLVSEYPLVLPGYYYEELSARSFTHLYASYSIPLDAARHFQFRLEAASAHLDYLKGFEQYEAWQTGAGCGLTYIPKSQTWRIIARYGYGFNALRNGTEGSHSVGLLFQYDFELRKKYKQGQQE